MSGLLNYKFTFGDLLVFSLVWGAVFIYLASTDVHHPNPADFWGGAVVGLGAIIATGLMYYVMRPQKASKSDNDEM